MASSVNHTVRLPRCRSASLYSDQFVTRRFGRAMWWRRSALYLCGMKARSGASKQTGSLRHLSHPCNTLDSVTAATFSPLFFGIATKSQAGRLTKLARAKLLKTDGIVTSLVETGQQWDAPNGWAPLLWIAIEGFRKYGEAGLAETIARRWMAKVIRGCRQLSQIRMAAN